jgi:transposase
MSHDQLLTLGNGNSPQSIPDPEVRPRAKRRTFSAEYKMRILSEAAACMHPSERGALLRREGLYASLLTYWRRELRASAMSGLTPKKRGPKADPRAAENAALRRENARLLAKLERAETIIEVQKKLSQLLSLPSPAESDEPNNLTR